MRVGISFDLSDVIFVDLFQGLLSFDEHGHGFAQLSLSIVFDDFDFDGLFVCF
jgi:hypothetical protein